MGSLLHGSWDHFADGSPPSSRPVPSASRWYWRCKRCSLTLHASMRNREGVIAAAVIVGIVGYMVAFKWRPFVSAERLVVTATPSLGGLFDSRPLTLRRGGQSCTEPVPIARDTTEARVYLTSTRGGMSPPAVSLTGPGGYAPTVRTELIAGGDNVPVIARFASPARTTESRLCIRNAGRITINLIGTTE